MARPKALILANHLAHDELASIAGNDAPQAIRIGNRPLVGFALDAARRAGIDDVAVMVCRESREPVRAALARVGAKEPTWLETPEPPGFIGSLLAAADFLGASPFLVHAGDAIVLDPLGPRIAEVVEGSADALMLTSAVRGGARQPLCVVDTAIADRVRDDALAGAQVFGPVALQLAAAAAEPSGGQSPGDLARACAAAGARVTTRSVQASWTYKGTIDDVLDANRMVLDELRHERPVGAEGEDVRIQGRVAAHPSATLERTTVRGPAVIGPGAVLRDAFIGPYSAIGEGVVIEGAEIEDSIVLAGATIRHPGRRLAASLVGEGATVARDFALPSSLRLRVGERTEVRLA